MSAEDKPPRIVGLTGGLASGKSTVARILRELGAVVVDADEIARQVVEPGRPAHRQIQVAFGASVLQPGGAIDRARLAELVFTDEDARRRLNAITHPEVAAESARRIHEAIGNGARLVVYDAPLIVANVLYRGLDSVIVLSASPAGPHCRAVSRGLTESQAQLRMRAQVDREARLAAATWVLDNSGPEAALRPKVEALWRDLLAGRRPPERPQ